MAPNDEDGCVDALGERNLVLAAHDGGGGVDQDEVVGLACRGDELVHRVGAEAIDVAEFLAATGEHVEVGAGGLLDAVFDRAVGRDGVGKARAFLQAKDLVHGRALEVGVEDEDT